VKKIGFFKGASLKGIVGHLGKIFSIDLFLQIFFENLAFFKKCSWQI
jgi:hypothetical protein